MLCEHLLWSLLERETKLSVLLTLEASFWNILVFDKFKPRINELSTCISPTLQVLYRVICQNRIVMGYVSAGWSGCKVCVGSLVRSNDC